jgi:hypothetical protein
MIKILHRTSRRFLILIASFAVIGLGVAPNLHAISLAYSGQVWDFGHVGIDFKIYHTYWIANNGTEPVKIKDVVVSCDCTQVSKSDSVIAPGDTVYFKMTFETKNYYGAVNRSFDVTTDSEELPELKFHYLATVGQWFYGVKPEPISLFFLPSHKSFTVTVTNTSFDEIKTHIVEQADEFFTTEVKTASAARGSAIEIEVMPSATIQTGTYKSSFTFAIDTGKSDKPALLTIPVKIVRY